MIRARPSQATSCTGSCSTPAGAWTRVAPAARHDQISATEGSEARAGQPRDPVVGRQPEAREAPVHQPPEAAVLDRDRLGPAGGARGVDQVRQAIRIGPDLDGRLWAGLEAIEPEQGGCPPLEPIGPRTGGDRQRHASVLGHPRQPGRGQPGIAGQQRRSGAQHRELPQHQPRRGIEAQHDPIPGPDPPLLEPGREHPGPLPQLPVRQARLRSLDRHRRRPGLDVGPHPLEDRRPRWRGGDRTGGVEAHHDPVALGGRQHRQITDPTIQPSAQPHDQGAPVL